MYATEIDSFYSESAFGSDSGLAGQGVNLLNDEQEFDDPETASSSGVSHVPRQPSRIPSPRGMISRDSCLPSNTRSSFCTSGHVVECLPAPNADVALYETGMQLQAQRMELYRQIN